MENSRTSPEPRKPAWLPKVLEGAFLGIATRPHEVDPSAIEEKPVLSWTKAAQLLRLKTDMPRSEISATLLDPRALWIIPVTRERYGHLVRNHSMCVWDSLQPACIGVAVVDGIYLAVYDRTRAVTELIGNFVDATTIEPEELQAHHLKFLTDEIEPVWMGKPTPYFIS